MIHSRIMNNPRKLYMGTNRKMKLSDDYIKSYKSLFEEEK